MPLLHITPEKTIEIPCALFTSSSVELLLQNVSAHPYVAYKIKTTAPKSYLVRPSSGKPTAATATTAAAEQQQQMCLGVVPQGQTRSVQIVLQALTEEPSRTSSDRFLVQATPVESSLPLPRNYWLSLSKSDVEETRLSVVFKRTNGSSHAAPVGVGQQEDPHALPDDSAGGGGGVGGGALRAGGGPSSSPEGLSSATLPAAAAAGSSSSSSSSSKDLKQQYDQLVEYALALERHKEELARENEVLKQQLEARSSRGLGELWHLPVYLFVLFMAWYLLDRSFGGGASAAGVSAPRA
ncbi:hypothetical protein ACSSS7_007857 [Eimeria intestinalis]